MRKLLGLLVVAVGLQACPPPPGGGLGLSDLNFTKGYLFVKKDDRNVYLANQTNLSESVALSAAGNAKHPSLSPNGLLAVFVQSSGGSSELVRASTKNEQRFTLLSSNATAKNFRNPVFSPDGTKVVFGYDENSKPAIGVVGVDGAGFSKVTGGGAMAYGSPTFYPDGSKLLVAAGSSLSLLTQLESVSLSTGTGQTVASSLGAEAKQIANRVVISPDGKFAAFDASTNNGGLRIFVMNLSSLAVNQVTDHPGDMGVNDSFPTWVGNSQVAFGSDSGGADQVYVQPKEALKQSGGLTVPSALEPWFGPN